MEEVILYTDGACTGNPGPGGWAYILRHPKSRKEKRASGGERWTTNNRMELTAVIAGLKALKRPASVRVVTDSEYVSRGMNEWVQGWIRKGWKRGSKPVKNLDLWQELVEIARRHNVTFEHIYGHAGHVENEECDRMAVAAAQKAGAD